MGCMKPLDLFPLLTLGARAQAIPSQYEKLRQRIPQLSHCAWDDLPAQADDHGLEPLFYYHLKAANIAIPANIEQQLRARTIQHAHANHIRTRALAEIIDAFHQAKIDVLVLKGAALAHLVYPSPGLRVMRDMDILVGDSDAERAQNLLAQMSYDAPLIADYLPADFKHLPMAQRVIDGLTVTIEVHRQLFVESEFYQPIRVELAEDLETLRQTAVPFQVEGITAYTLGYNEMLTHVYRHMMDDALLRHLRLINWADLVSVAEQFVNEINWTRIAPCIRSALGMIYHLTPLTDNLIRAADIKIDDALQEVGTENFWHYSGWPRSGMILGRTDTIGNILRQSFFPPAWWLCFFYGLNERQVVMPGRLVLHQRYLASRFFHVMLDRAKKRIIPHSLNA